MKSPEGGRFPGRTALAFLCALRPFGSAWQMRIRERRIRIANPLSNRDAKRAALSSRWVEPRAARVYISREGLGAVRRGNRAARNFPAPPQGVGHGVRMASTSCGRVRTSTRRSNMARTEGGQRAGHSRGLGRVRRALVQG
jgi:hypothetical protein